jgi:hypothetical protein
MWDSSHRGRAFQWGAFEAQLFRVLPATPHSVNIVAHKLTFVFIQVFLLLVTEMLIFCALIVPLPFTWRRKLFTFISESPIVAKLQYGMKVRQRSR